MSLPFQVKMAKIPTIQMEPKVNQVGNKVLLETAVEAEPSPTVIWHKDGAFIGETNPRYLMKMEKLNGPDLFKITMQILEFDKELAGVYKCLIENDNGKTAATFTVSTGDAPEFIDKPHIVQREKGKILAIKMKVKSKHPPTAEWTKDEKAVVENDRVKCVSKKGDKPNEHVFLLEIKEPAKDDEATYACIVKNQEGSNSQSLDLSFD